MLKKGQDFSEIRDSYVIFIYKHDKFHAGLPVYHINRYVGETGEMFEDGSNIIYVNGTYAGDDDLGKLLADFMQPDASKINFKELADGVRYFKEEGGWENMCEAVEKYAEKKSEIAERTCIFLLETPLCCNWRRVQKKQPRSGLLGFLIICRARG